MLDKLAQHFQENYYPDMSVDEVRQHLDKPEVLDNAMNHIAANGHDDPEVNDVSLLHGINNIVKENPEIHPDELAQKLSNTHGKPLVNWFNRQKEFEYSNPTDAKGNTIIDKKTGKPLEKTIKRVTAPDSILSSGFSKTVTNEQNEVNTKGYKKDINIPVPLLAPLITGTVLGINATPSNPAGGFSIPLGMIGGALGSYLLSKSLPNKETYMPINGVGSAFVNTLLGMPVKATVGSVYKQSNMKVVNERTKEKVNNVQDGDIKLSPRFM